ncbi:DUF6571 family protein [Streptomyces sp. B15]|uniref:DUF6571 family protein n=1 Tax=Streptomyces sp. B15 TaxID=1537797 RepID=UPI001B36D3BD|nr:DUF6571 family protein [Streptomyces sp. B15]MBQ1119087.1 hypothetical protein [Streptomyces sp. B15]
MITYRQLHDLRLGTLKKAVNDWKDMVDDLVELVGEDGHGQGTTAAGLTKKANGADWAGNNADVTKKFVTRTAGEFKDVLATARSVHTILAGLHTKMKAHKEALKEAVASADKSVHVTANGVVEPREDADPKPTQKQIDAVVEDIEKVLKAAHITDKGAAEALRLEAKDKYNFLSSRVTDFDKTRQAVKDADAVLKLTSKDPSKLSNTQLDHLNDWLKRSGKDPVFAERVASEMGPKKSLAFFAKAMEIDRWESAGAGSGTKTFSEHRKLLDARKKLLGELETGLGTTLATASRSESGDMAAWKKGVIQVGDQPVSGTASHKPIFGFQAMSNLMRHGRYDGAFLNDYGDALVAYEKKHTGDVKDPGPGGRTREDVLPWDHLPSYAQQDRMHFGPGSDKDAGVDPMTGFMKALSHNPEASTDFFGHPEEQTGKDGKGGQSHFDYLFKDREWESLPGSDGGTPGRDAMGEALEAGATGHVAGAKPDSLVHTPAQARIMEDVVKAVSDEPSLLTGNKEMGDSLGRMAREYMPDIYRGLESGKPPMDPAMANLPKDHQMNAIEQLFPVAGEPAVFGKSGEAESNVARFLISLGQSPEGYQEVLAGQKLYGDAVLKHHLDPDVQAQLPWYERFEGSDTDAKDRAEDVVERVSRQSGYVTGALTLGRQEAVVSEGLAHDAAYEKAQTRVGTWGYGAGATVTNVLLARGGVHPVASALISGLTGSGLFVGPSEWNMANDHNEGAEKAQLTSDYWSHAKADDVTSTNKMYHDYGGEDYGPGHWDTWVRAGSKDGFNDALVAGQTMATELTSGDQVKTLKSSE